MFFADIAANQTIDGQIFNGVTSFGVVDWYPTSNLNLLNPFPPSITIPSGGSAIGPKCLLLHTLYRCPSGCSESLCTVPL